MQSRPVDADQVAARLLGIAADRDAGSQLMPELSRFERASTVELSPNEEIEEAKMFETAAYHDLVNDGGQPAYPIDHLEKISKDPELYREVLRPWQEYPDTDNLQWDDVFQRQLQRWRDFRAWQQDNRGINDGGAGYLAFVDAHNKDYEILGAAWRTGWPRQTKIQHHESLRNQWKSKGKKRNAVNFWLRGNCKYANFSEYAGQVRYQLAKHGFIHPFNLLQDWKQQDQLTTWTEYLCYEYTWLDRYAKSIEKLDRERDKAWKELEEMGVLKPHETPEFLQTTESEIQHQAELNKARSAVTSSKDTARAALRDSEKAKHGHSRFTKEERVRSLAAAQSNLNAAGKALKALESRLDLISTFVFNQGPYYNAKRNHTRHALLVKWIEEQMPRIAENSLTHRPSVERGLDQESVVEGTSRTKRKRITQTSSTADGIVSSSDKRNLRKRARPDDTANEEQIPKRPRNRPPTIAQEIPPPRRSARIAAKNTAASRPPAEVPPPSSLQKTRNRAPVAAVTPSKPSDTGPQLKAKRAWTDETLISGSRLRQPRKRRRAK